MDHPKPRVVFSRCLGFDHCRYNGNIIQEVAVEHLKPFVEIETVCPEVEIGLGIPRDPIRLVGDPESPQLVQPTTGLDVTDRMISFARDRLGQLSTPDGFILYAGASAALALSVAAGAHGAITASTNHLPELVTEVVGRARRSPQSAAAPQRSLARAAAAIEAFGIPGTKAAARLAGLKPGLPRRPLLPLKRSQQRAVERAWLEAVADRTPA